MIVLPPKVFEYLGTWPYIATALYLAYRLSFLLLGQPLHYRLFFKCSSNHFSASA